MYRNFWNGMREGISIFYPKNGYPAANAMGSVSLLA
jgi:hypothetical protein